MSRVHTGLGAAYGTRLVARLLSLAASGVFLLIIFLAVTNEDGVQPRALPVLVLLGLTILASSGPTRVENWSSSFRATTPKITPEVLPIPPTINIPRYQIELIKGNCSTFAKVVY